MASYELLAVIISILGLAASITYYAIILNNANKTQKQQLETRQAQLFMHIYSNWYNIDFWEKWEDVMQFEYKDFEDADEKLTPETRRNARSLFAFFEGLGVLVKRRLIEPSLIDDLMSAMIISFWEKWGGFLY